jgi:hemolysin activation/secretion protein
MKLLRIKKTIPDLLRLVVSSTLVMLAFSAWANEDADTATARFDIVRFEVEGNTLLPQPEVQNLLAPFTGKSRAFGDVQHAVEALEGAYHQHGFNLVHVVVPEQVLNQDVVRLKVIETRIGTVTVTGNNHFDDANIRHSLPGLREGQTPNLDNISASLKVANENPAKKITLKLQGADKDDEINASLNVADEKTWKVGVTLDNTGNKLTGDTLAGFLYQNANMWGLDHVASFQYKTSAEHPSKISVYGVGYHIPLYTLGDSVDFFGSYSDVDSGTVSAGLFNLQVSGKGSVFGARYNHQLHRLGNLESQLVSGLDYKAYQNDVRLSGIQLGNDVTVHPLSLTYVGVWALPTAETSFSVSGVQNVPGGDQGNAEDFDRVRSGASAHYTILRYAAAYTQKLPQDWLMRLNLSGQYTEDLLIPGEQFGAGGASSVRGFHEREIANDKGQLISAEIYTPELCSSITAVAAQCRILAFVDSARVSRNDPLPGEIKQSSIGSFGLGSRIAMDRSLTMQVDYAQVFDAGGSQAKGDQRLHFSISYLY